MEQVAGAVPGGRNGATCLAPVARVLGEKPRTVYAWYRKDRIPVFRSALNIVIASGGKVDWNGIYGPFGLAAVEVGHGLG